MTRAPLLLIAIDPLMYREGIAHAMRKRRPSTEVRTAEPGKLDGEAKRLSPDLVVCHRASAVVRRPLAPG